MELGAELLELGGLLEVMVLSGVSESERWFTSRTARATYALPPTFDVVTVVVVDCAVARSTLSVSVVT